MGRIRAKSKKAALVPDGGSANAAPKAAKTEPTMAALLEKAQTLITQCDYPLALQFATRILEREPGHTEAREIVGVCYLEMGELEQAKKVRQFLRLSI